jgi:FixJ family two-component response regulator
MERVFLVDGDAAGRASLAAILREDGLSVEEFDSAEAFLACVDLPAEGCLVLEVSMPGLGGFELQARLRNAGRHLPTVFLTGHGDIPMSVQAIKSGAADFLIKPVNAGVLIDAIRTAIEQGAADSQSRAAFAAQRQRFAALTAREREVLEGLVNGRLNKQIAGDLGLAEQTVKWHRAHLMERMQARTVAELMHMAARVSLAGHPM